MRGASGVDTFYNADGTRAYTLQGANWREDYLYDGAGRLTQVFGGSNMSAAGMLRGKFTYDALASPLVQSPYRDRTVGIVQVEAPDPATVVVTLAGPNCAVLHSLRQPLLPLAPEKMGR